MKRCLKLSAAFAAVLAAVTLPAVAAETIYIETTPSTTIYAPVEADTYYFAVPQTTTVYYDAPITVYGYRNDDDRITSDVIGQIATDPRISGVIGVQTDNNVVTLDGRVTTPGQARRAEMDAHSVGGVAEVQNQLRTRVGGS